MTAPRQHDDIHPSREEINDKFHDLQTELNETRHLLIGVDGKNGVRGDLKVLTEEVETLHKSFDDYVHVERKKSCFGFTLVEQLRKDLNDREKLKEKDMRYERDFQLKMLEMSNDMKKAQRSNYITLIVAFLAFLGSMVGKF